MQARHGYLLLAVTLMAAATPARAQYGGGFGGGFPGGGGLGGGGLGGSLGGGALGGGLGGGQAAYPGPVISADPALVSQYTRLQTDLSIQTGLYREKVKKLDMLRADYVPSSPQVKQATESLERTRGEMNKLQVQSEAVLRGIQFQRERDLARIEAMLAPYQKPVSVDLRDATVRQAAEALSKVAGMEISVDGSVPETTRLKVQARGVALGAILEAIAEPAGLELAPAPRGIKITTWPSLKVNDDVTVFTGQFAPWADELVQRWGFRPSFGGGQRSILAQPGFGGGPAGFPGGALGGGVPTAPVGVGAGASTTQPVPTPAAPELPPEAAPPAVTPVPTVTPGPGAATAGAVGEEPLALLALGNQNVVSLEPAPDDPQRAKVLRLYRFRGGGPRVVSVTQYAVARTDRFPPEIALPRAGGFEPPTWSLQGAGPGRFAVVEKHPRVRGEAVLLRAEFRLQGDQLIPMGLTVNELPAPKASKTTPARGGGGVPSQR